MLWILLVTVPLIIIGLIWEHYSYNYNDVPYILIVSGLVALGFGTVIGLITVVFDVDLTTYPVEYDGTTLKQTEVSNYHLKVVNRRSCSTFKKGITVYELHYNSDVVLTTKEKDKVISYFAPNKPLDVIFKE